MATVELTPRAVEDVRLAVAALGLPADTWARIGRSLRVLESFPLAGRALEGRWAGTRFVLGPWPWMILVYLFDEQLDAVRVVAVHDARASTAASDEGR